MTPDLADVGYAERDEAVWALGKLTAELDAEPDRIAELSAERDALAAKVERVRALHFGVYVEYEDRNRCFECGDDWPCPTARALDGGES